jgi:hypothetical protein
MNRPGFQLYSSLGFGVTSVYIPQSQVKSWNYLNLHGSLLGMRFGGQFGGFVEFGYGYKGIVNAGIAMQFKQ